MYALYHNFKTAIQNSFAFPLDSICKFTPLYKKSCAKKIKQAYLFLFASFTSGKVQHPSHFRKWECQRSLPLPTDHSTVQLWRWRVHFCMCNGMYTINISPSKKMIVFHSKHKWVSHVGEQNDLYGFKTCFLFCTYLRLSGDSPLKRGISDAQMVIWVAVSSQNKPGLPG